jgi:hypothetical protein
MHVLSYKQNNPRSTIIFVLFTIPLYFYLTAVPRVFSFILVFETSVNFCLFLSYSLSLYSRIARSTLYFSTLIADHNRSGLGRISGPRLLSILSLLCPFKGLELKRRIVLCPFY